MNRLTRFVRCFSVNTTPVSKENVLSAEEAILLCKLTSRIYYDHNIELALNLGIDPRKPNQNIRGSISLPFGTGKPVRIAVFAKGDKVFRMLLRVIIARRRKRRRLERKWWEEKI